MLKMKGSLQLQATMSQAQSHSESLPTARIRCNSGRIQVGNHTYQSASDALSAYMQQFEPKQAGKISSSPSVKDAVLDAVIKRYDAANVTGLLTGSSNHEDKSGIGLDNRGSFNPSCLFNGGGSTQKSVKHSVSFALPNSADDSVGHSRLSGTVGVSGSLHSLTSSEQYTSSLFDSKLHGSSNPNSITQNTSTDLLGPNQISNTNTSSTVYSANASGDISSRSVSKSNGFVDNGLPALSASLVPKKPQPKHISSSVLTKRSGHPESDSRRAKSEVELLLTEAPSQSDLSALSQESAGEGKLKSLLRETSVPETSSTSSDKSVLQQEVEEALSRSAQLLETIKTDVLVSPRCVSDVGSLSTDVLLSINPQNPGEAVPEGGGRESRSRHRYSYHTPAHHPRSLSVGSELGGGEQRTIGKLGRRQSLDGLESLDLQKQRFLDLNDSMSVLSDSENILRRLQAADLSSVSGLTVESKEMKPRATGQTGPPSWIQELIPPVTNCGKGKDLTDSLFSERDTSGGRKAPSWVNGLEQSDVASSVGTQELHDAAETLVLGGGKKLHGADMVKKAFEAALRADDTVPSELSYAGPGLNYSDLVSSPAANKNKPASATQLHTRPSAKVSRARSFSGTDSSPSMRRGIDRSKPPVTINRIFQDLAGVDTTRAKPLTVAPNLSSSLGADSSASLLRRRVCDESVEAKSSLDKYLSQVTDEADSGNRGRRREQMSEIPRCSSVNMLNGSGGHPEVPSNITGASSITKDSNFSSKLCLDDPTLTPACQRAAGREARGSSGDPDLLEGDRPWESMLPSYKAPVYVGNDSLTEAQASKSRPETPTLSGGQQPGSMEALKQMLFRLQSEESSSAPPPPTAATAAQEGGETELVPALKDYNFEVEPGGQSLERALVHLGRLKTLVQTGTVPPELPSTT